MKFFISLLQILQRIHTPDDMLYLIGNFEILSIITYCNPILNYQCRFFKRVHKNADLLPHRVTLNTIKSIYNFPQPQPTQTACCLRRERNFEHRSFQN